MYKFHIIENINLDFWIIRLFSLVHEYNFASTIVDIK